MTRLLRNILSTQSESGDCRAMIKLLSDHAKSKRYYLGEDEEGNLYMQKGESETYPCLVAHMDTVHAITKGGIHPVVIDGCVTGINPLTMEQTGIGGDDKCGIYAALQCLRVLPSAKAVFVVDEEIGCAGSNRCDLSFFGDCRFVLQADRRGNSDWVSDISGPLGSKEFQAAVKPVLDSFGYKPCHGMMSDVMELRDRQVGVSVANMSAGYYNPHSASEFICLRDLKRVCAMMIAICQLEERFPFTYTAPPRKLSVFSTKRDWFEEYREAQRGFPDYQPDIGLEAEYCMNCSDVFPAADMREVAAGAFVCVGCYNSFHGYVG